MTKITLPKIPKYEITVAERKVVYQVAHGYCYAGTHLRGHYAIVFHRIKTGGVREVVTWDTPQMAKKQAECLRRLRTTHYLDSLWKQGQRLVFFK